MTMENTEFNKLLLRTAFSCMACDGHIDKREVSLIKNVSKESHLMKDLLIDKEIDSLVSEINEKGHMFLADFLYDLKHLSLTEDQELSIIDIAIKTINADEKVEYSEIKFFKIIRSKLKISNSKVLTNMPEIEEFLEQDIISDSYIEKLHVDFFGAYSLPKIENIHNIDLSNLS
jgi:uncharacterized tellurite resistance protein B-like protein